MTPVYVQIKYFLNTIAIGLIIGIFFDFYRAIRFLMCPHKWTADLLDIFISILFTIVTFLLLLFSNWGEVRLYVFLGIGLGVGVYIKYCSANIFSWWFSWFSFLIKSIKILVRIICFPFRLIKRVLVFPLGLISMLLYKVYKILKPFINKPCGKIRSVVRKLSKVFHRP